MSPDLVLSLLDLNELSRPSVGYLASHGIDFAATIPACGGVFLAPIRLVPPRFFEPDPDGTVAAYCEVFDEDAETVIDVVGWSQHDPHKVRVLTGRAPALGLNAAVNPSTYFAGEPLRLHRTPLGWLKGGCAGSVILDPAWGARWLLDLPTSTFALEDDEHAREIYRARRALFDQQSLVVPARPKLREAA